MKDNRTRNYSLVSYLDESIVRLILEKNLSIINRWAYITHDKDVKEDGTPKGEHVHIYVEFNDKKSVEQARSLFSGYQDENGKEINTLGKAVIDKVGVLQYLVHKNDPDKAQYDVKDVVAYKLDYLKWYESAHSSKPNVDDTFTIVCEMLNGRPTIELVSMYGRDFVYHINAFRQVVDVIKAERESEYLKEKFYETYSNFNEES